LSLRTMQILMLEIGLCDTVDPLAGSYFVETMTNRMERLIVETMDRLDAEGGIVQGVTDGRVQAEVNRQAFERELRQQRGETKKVGVNCFAEDEPEEPSVEFHPYRQAEAGRQIERLRRIRTERDSDAVARALARVRENASGGRNVMPAVMDAVEAYGTVGEVCGALKSVFGTYQEPVRF